MIAWVAVTWLIKPSFDVCQKGFWQLTKPISPNKISYQSTVKTKPDYRRNNEIFQTAPNLCIFKVKFVNCQNDFDSR